MATHKKLIPTYIKVDTNKGLKYAPAYKIGDDDNAAKPIFHRGKLVLFHTPQEALNYLNE